MTTIHDNVAAPAPPHDIEAENAVLGAVMLSNRVLAPLVAEEGLRATHFYRERNRLLFAAMLDLHDAGRGVDVVTLTDLLRERGELETVGGAGAVDALAALSPSAGNARSHAKIVVEQARWREALNATYEMQEAAHRRDWDAFAAGEQRLPNRHEERLRSYTSTQLAERLHDRIESGEQPERFPWPFRQLNVKTRGGMARGQVTLIAGPTSHGKSVLCDMALHSGAAHDGRRAHLFLNEMTEEERSARTASRLSGVPWERIFTNELSVEEKVKVYGAIGRFNFGLTECPGWTARDICREVRRSGYDLVAVDLVNKLPFGGRNRVEDLTVASIEFNALAQDTGCHVLLVAHVNRNRVGIDGRRPNPTLADVKDCAALADDANNVLFVWRDQDDDTGDPTPEGIIRFGKARGGQLGGLDVTFDGEHMLFEPAGRPDLRVV